MSLREQRVDPFPHERHERRRVALCRNRDGDAVTANDAAQIRARVLRIVYGVHEEPPRLGGGRDLAVHRGRRRGDHQPGLVEIGRLERPFFDLHGHAIGIRDVGRHVRRHNADARVRGEQLSKLRRRHRAAANEHDGSAGQVQEQR